MLADTTKQTLNKNKLLFTNFNIQSFRNKVLFLVAIE